MCCSIKVYDNTKNRVTCSNFFSQDISTVEAQIQIKKEMFWTDSEVVLAYMRNEAMRCKIFVANRIELVKALRQMSVVLHRQNRTLLIMLQGALAYAFKTYAS